VSMYIQRVHGWSSSKGLLLSRDKRIRNVSGPTWAVPSQSGDVTAYLVNVVTATCSCPDYEVRRSKCKHQWAVEMVRTVETSPDGSKVVTESIKVTRKTYTQDWPRYNAAQCAEKETVQTLLRGLCDGIATPAHPGRGPKPLPLCNAVFGMTMKVYTGMSGRRATTDIKACADDGHISRAPSYNAIFTYFDKPEMTSILTHLIEQSAKPSASVETSFAVDSTGFGTAVYRRWFDAKYGREMSESTWLKAHAMIGVTTNIVTAINVTDSSGADSPQLPSLVASTAQRFALAEVSADKAYLGHANLAAIEAVGAVPFVPFKSNSRSQGSAAWRRMWATFLYRQDEFLAHYHKRSNVESTFSAIKRKFGGAVRSKNFTAQSTRCSARSFATTCPVSSTRCTSWGSSRASEPRPRRRWCSRDRPDHGGAESGQGRASLPQPPRGRVAVACWRARVLQAHCDPREEGREECQPDDASQSFSTGRRVGR
jgi:transposase